MHKSRLGTMVIDCQGSDFDGAIEFWSNALGCAVERGSSPEDDMYAHLVDSPEAVKVLVQKVDHPSRVHIDIETDDVDAEVNRLESLGAKRLSKVKSWWVMEAPSGQRFCVVNVQRAGFSDGANVWD